MRVTLNLCTDGLTSLTWETQKQLREIKCVYNYACIADVLRAMLEPDIAKTVTKMMRRKIKYARAYEIVRRTYGPSIDDF